MRKSAPCTAGLSIFASTFETASLPKFRIKIIDDKIVLVNVYKFLPMFAVHKLIQQVSLEYPVDVGKAAR